MPATPTPAPDLLAPASRYGRTMLDAARWSVVGMAAVLPFSTAATNVFMALALIAWLASGQVLASVRLMARQPVAVGATLAVLALCAGALWSSAPPEAWAEAISKYRKLLLLALLVVLLGDWRWQSRVLLAFFGSVAVLLLVSTGIYLGVPGLPEMDWYQGAIVRRSHITHSTMMALLVLASGVFAWRTRVPWQRGVALAIAALALANMLTMIHGRTGYLLVAALLLWAGLQRFGWKGAVAALALGATVAVTVYSTVPSVRQRVDMVRSDLSEYRSGEIISSSGVRLHFYKRAIQILRDHPWLGTGTGSWSVEYERRNANDPEILKTFPGLGNPHNDYLLIGVQLGLAGIALFVAALVALYRLAGRLPTARAWLARGTLVAYASGALVNSFLWDAAEGTIFVLLIGALFAGPWPPRAAGSDAAGSGAANSGAAG